MGKLAFRFGLGRGGGGGGGGGAVPPYLLLAGPPFLLLTPLRIGPGRRRGRASRRGRRECGGSAGPVRGVWPSSPLLKGRVCVCGSPPVPPVGLLRGGVRGGHRFLPSARDASCRRLSSCFSAVTTGGGTRSLTRYQPRPGRRAGCGDGGGREDLVLELRLQKSLQALRCNKSETSTAGPLNVLCLGPLGFPARFVTYFDR